MKKVLVIGCPGAGKTTFSLKLAAKTGLPVIHLDYYFLDKNFDYANDKTAWRARVLGLIKGKEWIVDGNYSSSFPERFEMADTILFFDFPLHTRLSGIFKRRWKFRNKTRPGMPDDWQERINWGFLSFAIQFRRIYMRKFSDIADQKIAKKVITFKNHGDAQKYLDSIKTRVE